MTEAAAPASTGTGTLAATFGALAALTAGELLVPGLSAPRSLRIALLVGLLLAKVVLVFLVCLRVRANRRLVGLLAVALVMAVGFAVVLMLESNYRGAIR